MTLTIKERITTDLKDAMRARDQLKLDALRLITSAIKQIEVDERIVVDDARLVAILDKMAKQRHESIEQFERAARADLIEQEQFELAVIGHYLPEPLTNEEIAEHITEAFLATQASQMSDMSKVMAILKPLLQGRADIGKVSALVKTKLTT